MDIVDFLKRYQKACELYYEATYDEDEEDEEPLKVLLWNEERLRKQAKQGLFKAIIQCSNISVMPQALSEFAFLKKVRRKNAFEYFGENDSDEFFGVHLMGGNICLIEEKLEKNLAIAKDEFSFLTVLSILVEYYTAFHFKKGELKQMSDVKKMCILAAGGERYRKYYDFIFVEDDNEQFFPLWG